MAQMSNSCQGASLPPNQTIFVFQQRSEEKDSTNSDQSEEDDNFDLRRGSSKSSFKQKLVKVPHAFIYQINSLIRIHWANIRPTSTENDSGTADRLIHRENEERLRRREKLANLKLENNALKSKLTVVERANDQLKWYKRVSGISTACLITLLIAFTGFIIHSRQVTCSDIFLAPPVIILREQWADKELKPNTSDLEPLPLPISRGVIVHHTRKPDDRCFSYGKRRIKPTILGNYKNYSEDCVKVLNSILDDFLNLKYSDIGYNYLIGWH